jgi:hypothetical protein
MKHYFALDFTLSSINTVQLCQRAEIVGALTYWPVPYSAFAVRVWSNGTDFPPQGMFGAVHVAALVSVCTSVCRRFISILKHSKKESL